MAPRLHSILAKSVIKPSANSFTSSLIRKGNPMVLSDRKVLVTGGSGFIASHLVRRLVHAGAHVSILTKYNSVIDNARLAGLWDRITPIEADLRNLDSLAQLRSLRPEIIFHFAAYNHVGDSFLHVNEAIESNARG